MSTKLVRAIRSFDHYGMRKRGTEFPVSHIHAEQLRKRGLVIIVGESDQDPIQPAGRVLPSSASPAGQALTSKTSNTSDAGDLEESSEETSESETSSEGTPQRNLRPWQKQKKKR